MFSLQKRRLQGDLRLHLIMKRREKDFLYDRGNDKMTKGRFALDVKRKFFLSRVGRTWHRFPRWLLHAWKCSKPPWMELGAT